MAKIRDAEATANVEHPHGRGRRCGKPACQLDGPGLRLYDGGGTQVLRPREDMKPDEVERQPSELRKQVGHLFRVDAELLRPARHLHARALQLEIGIHPDRDATAPPSRFGQRRETAHFAGRLDIHDHAGGERALELVIRLSGARETNRVSARAGGKRNFELAGGGDIQAVDETRDVAHDVRHRVGFHRVVQVNAMSADGRARAECVP